MGSASFDLQICGGETHDSRAIGIDESRVLRAMRSILMIRLRRS